MRSVGWIVSILVAAAVVWFLFDRDGTFDREPAFDDGSTPADGEPGVGLEGRAFPTPGAVGDGSGIWKIPGRVVDALGEPVAGVTVLVRREPAARTLGGTAHRLMDRAWRRVPSGQTPMETLVSDAGGRIQVTPPLSPSAWISVEARPEPPRVGTTRTIAGLQGALYPLVLVVTDGHALRGRVVDAAGAGVAAQLELSMWAGAAWRDSASHFRREGLRTDEQGCFALASVPGGLLSLIVHVPGRIRRTFLVATPSSDDVVLRLYDEDGVQIEGTVTNRQEQPVAGARIALHLTSAADRSDVVAMATTNADGVYACEGLPPGALADVVCEAAGYRQTRFKGGGRVLAPGETFEARLVLERGTKLAGRVRTKAGTPVANATVNVNVTEESSIGHYEARTDEAGAYEVVGLPVQGRAGIRVDADGLFQPVQERGVVKTPVRPGQLTVRLGADEDTAELDVVLLPGVPLAGRTVDLRGAPVAAQVRLEIGTDLAQGVWQYVTFPRMHPTARSGSDGTFRFEGLAPGTRWRPVAFAGDLQSAPHEPVDIPATGPVRPIVLVVGSAGSIAGVVVEPDGTPVVGVRIFVPAVEQRAHTGPGGRFILRGLAAGAHRLQVGLSRAKPVADPVEVVLAEGEDKTDVRITTRRTLVTTGRILSVEGEPLVRRMVFVQDAAMRGSFGGTPLHTDENGDFELRQFEAGDYRILVDGRPAGDVFSAGDTGLVLQARPAGRDRVTIRILGPDGEPVPKCELLVMTGDGSSKSGSTTTVDGGVHVFRTRELAAHTDIQVTNARDAKGAALNVLPAELLDVDMTPDEIVIRLEAGRDLRGTVVGPDGGGVEGVRIDVGGDGLVLGQRRGAVSDAEGRFALSALPSGEVTLHVRPKSPWLPQAPIVVPTRREEVRITLTRGQRLFVTVAGPDGKPVSGAAVRVTPTDYRRGWHRKGETNDEGVFETAGIAADAVVNVRVEPSAASALPLTERRELPVGDGRIRIELETPLWIEGVVVDADGKPIGDVSVSVDGMIEPRLFGLGLRTQTDKKDGRFRLGPLAAGTYWISTGAVPGMAGSGQFKQKAPAAGVRIVLPRAAQLDARLLVDDIKGWSVVWRTGREGFSVNLGDDGRFRLVNVPDLPGVFWGRGPGDQYVLLEDALPSAGPFTLRVQVGGRITGKVVGPREAKVPLYAAAARGDLSVSAPVQDDGTFQLAGVPPGSWRVVVFRNGVEVSTAVQAEPGGEPVVLELTPKPNGR